MTFVAFCVVYMEVSELIVAFHDEFFVRFARSARTCAVTYIQGQSENFAFEKDIYRFSLEIAVTVRILYGDGNASAGSRFVHIVAKSAHRVEIYLFVAVVKINLPFRHSEIHALRKVHVQKGYLRFFGKFHGVFHRVRIRFRYFRIKVERIEILVEMQGEIDAVFPLQREEVACAQRARLRRGYIHVEFHEGEPQFRAKCRALFESVYFDKFGNSDIHTAYLRIYLIVDFFRRQYPLL